MWQIFQDFLVGLGKFVATTAFRGSVAGALVVALGYIFKKGYPAFETWLVVVVIPWLDGQLTAIFPNQLSGFSFSTMTVYLGFVAAWVPVKFAFLCFMAYVTFGFTYWALRRVLNLYPGMGAK